ncbi:MAG: hypothetical protein KC441_05460 [Anaerolineales bacterium]|nr:hypothetical protein [Anaerolineales bacterium]
MQTVEQVIENALRQFKEQAKEQAELDRRNKAENQKRLDRERAEVREWLVQHIPQQVMQYIDFGNYSHDAASSYHSWSPYGVVLEMTAPKVAPIRFRIYRNSEKFEFQPLEEYGRAGFVAPNRVRLDSDPDYDDGKPYIRWEWSAHRGTNFITALGEAAALYEEQGQRLEEELRTAIETWQAAQHTAVQPAPNLEDLSLEERQVLALEAIADALGTLAYNGGY